MHPIVRKLAHDALVLASAALILLTLGELIFPTIITRHLSPLVLIGIMAVSAAIIVRAPRHAAIQRETSRIAPHIITAGAILCIGSLALHGTPLPLRITIALLLAVLAWYALRTDPTRTAPRAHDRAQ